MKESISTTKTIIHSVMGRMMALVMFLTGMAQVAWADEDDAWDNINVVKIPDVERPTYFTDGDHYTFEIRNAIHLAWFAQQYRLNKDNNDERNKYAKSKLVFRGDVDLKGHYWRAIGEGIQDFEGEIEGNGHVIRNMVCGYNEGDGGLINIVVNSCKIDSLKFIDCKNVNDYGSDNQGILVGWIRNAKEVEISNISFSNCTVDGMSHVSMVAGCIEDAQKVTITQIEVTDCSSLTRAFEGGAIAGRVNNIGMLKVSNVKVSRSQDKTEAAFSAWHSWNSCCVGGIHNSSFEFSHVTVDNCLLQGTSAADDSGYYTGMVVGHIENGKGSIDDVLINEGEIRNGGHYVGGLVGVSSSAGSNLITVNSCRVLDLKISQRSGGQFCGGLVGEAQGIWQIKNCFTEMQFEKHGALCGGLIGRTQYANTNVSITNTFVHAYWEFFQNRNNDMTSTGGLVGDICGSSHVDLTTCGVIRGSHYDGPTFGQFVGSISDNGSLSGGNCFMDRFYASDDDLDKEAREHAFSSNVRSNPRFTFGKIYCLLNCYSSDNPVMSYDAACMNEVGACLGIQSHGKGDNCRQFLPLDDPMKGMVVRYKNAENVKSVQSPHLLESYGKYDSWAMMAVGDTTTVEMSPLDNRWYIDNKSIGLKYSKRLDSYKFSMVADTLKREGGRSVSFSIAQIPQVSFKGVYDAIRQRSNLTWTVDYLQTPDTLWNQAKWAILRGDEVLKDSMPLTTRAFVDNQPIFDTETYTSGNAYSIVLVSKDLHITHSQGLARAEYNVHATDNILLELKAKSAGNTVELTTGVPNSKRFDKCKVIMYRWDNETGQQILDAITAADSTLTDDEKALAFADTLRLRYAKYNVTRITVQEKFEYNADSKDSLIAVGYKDTPANICSNYNYVFSCEDFTDEYYKKRGAVYTNSFKFVSNSKIAITSMDASKGENATKVFITWNTKQNNGNELNVQYKILRKFYKESDSDKKLMQTGTDWDTIYVVTNALSTNSFDDEKVIPGYVYLYKINACIACDGVFNDQTIAATKEDFGYTASHGTIMGSITYASGSSRVEGVDVRLTTDTESMQNIATVARVRSFHGTKDCLPLAQGLNDTFWNGNWTLQFILRPQDSGRVLTLPGRMTVGLKDNRLVIADYGMHVDFDKYNYILLRHVVVTKDSSYYQLGYAKRPATNDPKQIYAHYVDWIMPAQEIQGWVNNKLHETTKINEMDFGCTSDSLSKPNEEENVYAHSFKGLVDEVRLWDKLLTEKEVQNTFDRYLVGNEADLAAYYTFDEGVRHKVFDTSHPADKWNKHHADVTQYDANASPSQYLPEVETRYDLDSVLCYRGVTNSQGEYQIAGVPYIGEGTNYMVRPVYGTHEFYPTNKRAFVSASSLVHSGIDFADKSSFSIPVVAVYSGTTLPVQGLIVTIDGAPATSKDGTVITDVKGKATVSVPIGSHRLKLVQSGHTLANNGYACDIAVDEHGTVTVTKTLQDKDSCQNFQNDLVAPLTFWDNTRVSICGHVVGGSVEDEKLIGGGNSQTVNNIGRATIFLKPENCDGYSITADGKAHDYSMLGSSTGINSTVIHKSDTIEITTDSKTGEYYAMVPPVNYRVVDVRSTSVKYGKALDKTDFNLDKVTTSLYPAVNKVYCDTVTVKTTAKKDTTSYISYNLKKNFACYVDPTLEVYNAKKTAGKDSLMMGERIYPAQYIDGQGKTCDDSISIWSDSPRDGSSDSYRLKMTYKESGTTITKGLPVFMQGNGYALNIKLYDCYLNRETNVRSKYNLGGVPIKITNGLAAKNFKIVVTDTTKVVVAETDSMTTLADSLSVVTTIASSADSTSSDGITKYDFTAGYPTITYPFSRKIEFSYELHGKTYTGNPIEGIVLGCMPIPGNSFITEGPNVVDFVLRDPPGSNSFSWIDAGSTIGNTYTYTHGGGINGGAKWSISDAIDTFKKTATLKGPGVFEICYDFGTEKKAIDDHGFNLSLNGTGGKTKSVSYTVNNKLQTSSDNGFVGDEGDMYIGQSNNILTTRTHNVDFNQITTQTTETSGVITSKSGKSYQLLNQLGYGQDVQMATTFVYTQKHIISTLIPDLRKARRAQCIEVESLSANLPLKGDTATYYVRKGTKDTDEWVEGRNYKWVYNKNINQSDKVQAYSSWIKGWENAIAANEEKKYSVFKEFGTRPASTWTDKSANSKYAPSVQYGYLGNISIDGGSSSTTSISRSYSDKYTETEAWTANETNAIHHKYETRFLLKGTSVVLDININAGAQGNYNRSENKAYTQNMGYTIKDGNTGDYLSISTYLPKEVIKKYSSSAFGPAASSEERPGFKDFFVFRLVGGQTRCPWEGPKMSLYYKNEDNDSVPLHDGSIAVEEPKLTLGTHYVTDIPNGRSVTVPITLANVSTATITQYPKFIFTLMPETNPDGLQMYLDGEALGSSGMTISLTAGQAMNKTLEFRQTKTDVLNYDNLKLWLHSSGEISRGVNETLSIHFKPASSPVTLKSSVEYVNKSNVGNGINFTLSDYEPTFTKFAGIRVQRKKKDANEDFYTIANVINDTALVKERYGKIPEGSIIIDHKTDTRKLSVPVSMRGISDGTYLFRAVSYSINGQEEVQTISDTLTVVKDTINPTLLATPLPSDGYYTNGSEISVQFNEKINTSKLSDKNFVVTGALNDALVTHQVGLHFDGNSPAKTDSRMNIFGKSSTVAFWYKPQMGKRSCLFSQQIIGEKDKKMPLALYYNDDGTMSISFNGNTVKSTKKAEENGTLFTDWMYAVLTVDKAGYNGKGNVTLYNLFGTSDMDESRFITVDSINPSTSSGQVPDCNVPLYIGGSVDGDSCYADIEGFVVYDEAKPFAEAASDKSNKHTGNTRGLRAYWPMDEGNGLVVHEKVAARNLTLQGTDNWYSPVSNYALNLNGKDQYLSLNTANIGITQAEDYAVEMWFRSEVNSEQLTVNNDMALFSCGYGGDEVHGSMVQGSKEVDSRKHVSMLLGTKGQIILNANGKTYEMGNGYNDNEWHHLALNVPRDGYVSLMVDTVDIFTSGSILGSTLGSLERATMQLGALVYTEFPSGTHHTADFFQGRIDEFRIWNASKTTRNIKDNAFNRLQGDEAGLVAYYPFEKSIIVANQQVTDTTLCDMAKADNIPGFTPSANPLCVGFNQKTAPLYQNGAMLKAAGCRIPLSIDWTHNGNDRIVFSFPASVAKYRIEDCTLNFQLKDVEDMVGNKMLQPVNWSVYVDQNTLRWVAENCDLLAATGQPDETTVYVYNDSPAVQTWNIMNVPSWLHLSQTSGITQPYESTAVTVQTVDGTVPGNYQQTMYLTGSDGLFEPLTMSLAVTAEKPDWKVTQTDGSIWMTIMGRLKIGDTWCTDENSLVGVFDTKDRCLALASPKYYKEMSTYLVSLNVKGNADMEKGKLALRVWDSQSGLIYTHINMNYKSGGTEVNKDTITFVNQQVIGNFSYPCIMSTDNQVLQTIALHNGWNMISLWLAPTKGLKGASVFGDVLDYVCEVKDRLYDYSTSDAIRNMNISLADGYMVYATAPTKLNINGVMAKAADVAITFHRAKTDGETSWQWIGFPLRKTMTIAAALADMNPTVDEMIKSEDAFSVYNGTTWIGELTYLSPGRGYLYGYKGTEGTSWHYPNAARQSTSALTSTSFTLGVDPYSYENYTAVEVSIPALCSDSRYQLGAFTSDGVCHGVADLQADGKCNISIYGAKDESYSLRLYDRQAQNVIDLNTTKDADYTTPLQKLTIEITGIVEVHADANADDADYYTVGGVKLSKDSQKHGVLIHNNSKVARK